MFKDALFVFALVVVTSGGAVANAETAKRILTNAIPKIPLAPNWPEHTALDSALVTDRKLWPAETIERLRPILSRFL
jgi:5'-methylthioadenosine phosphorylase